MTYTTKELTVMAAQRILREESVGRSVDPHRLQWAHDILRGNCGRTGHGNTDAPLDGEVAAVPAQQHGQGMAEGLAG